MQSGAGYKLVKLPSGVHSVHSLAHKETFHPVIGPVAEAEALYVGQLQLRERVENTRGEFVIWDVGLGAAASVDSIRVRWPDGSEEKFPGGPADRYLTLRQTRP